MTITVRPATGDDVAGIDALLRTSFPARAEADLVRDLCADGDMVLTLVAADATRRVIGTVVFSRMDVTIGEYAVSAVALAPLAVDAAHRQHGVADALVRAGLEHLKAAGVVLCFVLGDPAYYRRFGFAADVARGYASPYVGDAFMALPLQGGLIPCGERGPARHAAAFSRLEDGA